MQRGGQSSSKPRTKLERLLRQDHSDVYFENDKLSDELSSRIQGMQKELLQHDILRTQEIDKLRREILSLRTNTSSAEQQLRTIRNRPHTAGYSKRTQSPEKPRARSAWGQTSERTHATKPIKYVVAGDDTDPGPVEEQRSVTPLSTASTLKNTRTLRRYQKVEGHHFKENNRYPEEWYVKCIPASDAAIYNSKRKIRGKSAPPYFDFLAKLREKDTIDKKLLSFTNSSKLAGNRNTEMGDSKEREGLSLICEEPVKPIVMSLRRLKELTNSEVVVDRGPSRNTQRQQNMLHLNVLERQKLETKVKEFCHSLEELKSREARKLKEREEELKKEAQEQEYLKNINLEEMEKQEEAQKDNDDDDKWDNRWR